MIDVSFVIPHKGRDDMLLETLGSIAELDRENLTIEVIVVSQNAAASAALNNMASVIPLQIVLSGPENTISRSRNLGVQHSKGDYLVFLDADIKLESNWLVTMKKLIADPDIALVSAMQKNSDNAPAMEKVRTSLSNAHINTDVSFLPGRNLFLARKTFDKVNGFPEHLVTCEDYYFTDQVAQLGKLFYTGESSYVHIGEDKSLKQMFSKEIWRGQSNIASIKGRRISLAEWPSFFVPVIPVFFAMLSLVCFVFGYTAFAISSFAMTLIPILVYSSRLKLLAKNDVAFLYCVGFYTVYFPARAIGTLLGVKAELNTNAHN